MPKTSIEDALAQIRSSKSESGSNTISIEDALSGIRSGKILPQEQKPIEEPPEEPSLLDRVKNFSKGVLDKIKTPAIEDALAKIRATPIDLTAAAPGPLQVPFQIGKAAARAAGVLSPEAQRTLGEVDKDVAIRTGKNFGQAVAGMGSGAGGIMKWAGAEKLGQYVSEYSDKMAQTYEIENPNVIDEFQTGLASTLVFAVPGIGVSAGTNFVAAIPALARYSKWIGAGVSGLLESGVEAGNAYEDALKGSDTREPMTPQQASAAAAKTFMLNLPTIVYTNQKGLFGESGGAVLKWIKSATAEGVQEFLQKIYGNFALKDPIMQGAIRSGVIGALAGGIMGQAMDTSQSPGQPPAGPQTPPPAAPPPAIPPQIPQETPPAAPVEPLAPRQPLEPAVAAPSQPTEPIDAALAKIRAGVDLGAPGQVTPATPAGGPETGPAQPVPSPSISDAPVELEMPKRLVDFILEEYDGLDGKDDAAYRNLVKSLEKSAKSTNGKWVSLSPESAKLLHLILTDDSSPGGRLLDTFDEMTPQQQRKIKQFIEDSKQVLSKEGERLLGKSALQAEAKAARQAAAAGKETDPAKIQQIKNSIAEGQMTLRAGTFNGRKLSPDELLAVRRSVENSLAKLGKSPIQTATAPAKIIDVTPTGYGPEETPSQPTPATPSQQEPAPATPPAKPDSTKIKKPLKIKPVDNVTAMTRVINKRSTLPILATVQVRNGEMSATDLEVSITKKTDMPDGTYLPVGKNFEPQAQFAMDDQPVIPGPGDPIGTVDKVDFIRNFERAGVASSTDESRYVLNSVLLEVKDGKSRLVATDGRVMSINDLDSGKLKDGQYIIPAVDRTAMALRSLSGDELKISVNGSTGITFEGSDGRVTVRLIEGHFPKYTEVLPKQYDMASKFSKTAFEDAMKELKPYIKLGEKGRSMIVEMGDDSVTLTVVYGNKETKSIEIQAQHVKSKHPGPGDNPGTIVMPMKTGEEKKNQIGVNPQYLSDTIAGISGEDVFLWTNGGENPMFVRGAAMKPAAKPQEKPKKAKKKSYPAGAEIEVPVADREEPIEKGGEKTPGAKQIEPKPVATKPDEKLPPRIETPELVRLAKTILGETPTIMKKMKDGVRGFFRPGEGSIALSADIFKDQDAAARTLAHEIGHAVDWLPDRSMAKGNILGSIASLHKYMASLIESMPNQTGRAPDQKELNKMRNATVNQVVKSHGKTLQQYFKDKSFRDSIKEEIKAEVKKNMEKMISERNLLTKKEIIAELKAVTQMWKPFDEKADPKFTAYRYNPRELYADAISVLLNDPAQLKTIAPKFYKALFDYMGTKPEFKSAYEALQKEIGSGKSQEVRAADVREMFKRADESGLADMDAMLEEDRGKLEKARYSLIDKNEAMIRRVSKRPTTPAKNPIFKLEAMNYTGSEEKAWMLENNDIKTYLEENGLSWDDLNVVTFHERVINDRSGLANPLGHTPKSSNEQMIKLEKDLGPDKWRVLKEAARRFRENYRVIRELLLESGMLSPELAQKVKDNDFYVTFDVVDKHIEGRYGQSVSSGIFKQYGTFQEITGPATATLQKGVSLIKAINKNNAARASVEYLSEAFPGEVLEAEFDHYHKAFKQPSSPKQGMIQFMQDGKVKAFYVEKYVAKMFEKDPSDLGFLINILRQTNRLWRGVFIEYNPGFQAFNLIRDFFRAYKNLPKSGVLELAKYYKRSFSKAMSYAYDEQNWVTNKMLRDKMLITVENRWGVNTEDEQVSALMRRYLDKLNREDNIFKRFFDHVDKFGRTIEALPKVAGYRYLKVNQKELNLTDEQIAHAIRGQVGSPDFLRRGANYSLMNSIFLFSNSIKEGIRSDLEVIRDRPQEFLLKTAKINLAPKILMYAMALGLLGDKWKKYMDAASTFDKMNYIIIPLGETSNGKPIYFRMPQDETGRFFGGMLWWALNKGRKGDLKSAAAYMAGQAPAPTPTIGLLVDTLLYSMGFNPYDYFRGKPAINETVFKAGGLRRDRDFLKYMANRMFGGFVQFDTNTLEKNRSTLEKSLNFPVSSNLLGRFLKNSDYGVYEQIKEVADKASTASARERLARRDAMSDRINSLETPTMQDAKQAYKDMRESGLLDRAGQGITPGEFIKQWNAMAAQKTGNRYIDAFVFRDTNEERAAMLKFYEQTLEPGEFASVVEQLKKKRLLGPGAWHLYKNGAEE